MRTEQPSTERQATLPALVRIAGFILIAILPLAIWIVGGTVKPYGREHTRFPRVGALFEGRGYDQLGQAVLDRSAATRGVVQIKIPFDYSIGAVDTKTVVSGKRDWLFLKADFWDGKCLDPDDIREALGRIDTLTEMANAVGIQTVVSVSADKSSLFPEMLLPIYRRYWRCKSENAELWRAIAREEAPQLMDHRVPLLAAKVSGGPTVYQERDTHWTPYGAALALRQLLDALFPASQVETTPVTLSGTANRIPDLSSMLLLPDMETYDSVDTGIAKDLHDDARTVIMHDSFYRYFEPGPVLAVDRKLKDIFPNSITLGFNDKNEKVAQAIDGASRLIVNTVERSLLVRAEKGSFGPSGNLTKAILARSAQAASACTDYRSLPEPRAEAADLEPSLSGKNDVRATIVKLPELGQGRSACIKITMRDWKRGSVDIFLPRHTDAPAPFAAGRSLRYRPDAGSVTAVLPDRVLGRELRIESPADAHVVSIEIGERPSAASIASADH